MKISDNINGPCVIMIGFTSYHLCFLKHRRITVVYAACFDLDNFNCSDGILFLPNLLEHKVEETELINGYLQPILSPLFHKPEKEQLFLWLNTKTDLKNYDKRPDGGYILIEKRRISQYTGFVEVKADYQKNNTQLTHTDLLRLVLFTNSSYDQYNAECILVLQAIGLAITAYGFAQHASGANIMFEIMKVRCPVSLNELPSFCMELNKLRKLQQFYDNYCSKNGKKQS